MTIPYPSVVMTTQASVWTQDFLTSLKIFLVDDDGGLIHNFTLEVLLYCNFKYNSKLEQSKSLVSLNTSVILILQALVI